MLGKPLFPGKNVVHQLELITDLLGTPSAEVVNKVRNEKARRYLQAMKKKPGIPFQQKFPGIRDDALGLLARLLAFDPSQRPTVSAFIYLNCEIRTSATNGGALRQATEALADPYFKKLSKPEREPASQPISKLEFDFERRKISTDVSSPHSSLYHCSILQWRYDFLRDLL